MSVTIREIKERKDLKKFIKFQYDLYKNNKYYVPPLLMDELNTFDRNKNPAFELSDAKFIVGEINNKIVGRIVAINNKPANQKYNTKNLRFNWFDCINDFEIAKSLFDYIEKWAVELGMDSISGPHGFTDLDPQGLLIEGFDRIPTIASFYNYEYYKEFLEKLDFIKEIDYFEYLSTPPYKEGIPKKLIDTAKWVINRYNYKLVKYDNIKEYIKRGKEIFKLLDESFSEIYGSVPLTDNQINYYIKKYISYINKDLIKLVENKEGEIIGFMITMNNLSKAYQKAKGRLFPFGIFHILKGFKNNETLDFYLAGVKKEYRGKGVDLIMIVDIVETAMKYGFKYAESNQELENNTKVQSEWKFFNPQLIRKRRIYKKFIK